MNVLHVHVVDDSFRRGGFSEACRYVYRYKKKEIKKFKN